MQKIAYLDAVLPMSGIREPRQSRAKLLWKTLRANRGRIALSEATYRRFDKRCNLKRDEVDVAIGDLVAAGAAHIELSPGLRCLTLVWGRAPHE